MHFHRGSAQFTCLNGLKVLLIVLITYTSCVESSLTQEELDYAISMVPAKFCGKKLTEAMKFYCTPHMKNHILNKQPVKKSVDSMPELDFDTFDLDRIAAENYDDEAARSHYKIEDTQFSNDIPFMYSSQGNGRRRRGIIEECCRRACYISELIRYCPQKG